MWSISEAKHKKPEPMSKETESGRHFTRKHPDSKGGWQLTQEEMIPINIKPTPGGRYHYPLAYPLDFELLDRVYFHLQMQLKLLNMPQ